MMLSLLVYVGSRADIPIKMKQITLTLPLLDYVDLGTIEAVTMGTFG